MELFIEQASRLLKNVMKNNPDNNLFIMFGDNIGEGKGLTKRLLEAVIDKLRYNQKVSCKKNLELEKYTGTIVLLDIEKVDIKELVNKISKDKNNNRYILCINKDIEKDCKYENLYDNFVKINLNFVSKYTNHLITADFEFFDFTSLYNENKSGKGILWNNSKLKLDNANNKIIAAYQDHKFNIGDDVYVYYTNLPDKTSRILLKCSVINNGYYNEKFQYERCWYVGEYNKNMIISISDKVPAIKLKIEQGIYDESNIEKFSYKNLIKSSEENNNNQYGLNIIQGKQYLKYPDNEKLIVELKKSSGTRNHILEKWKKYFANECALTKCKAIENDHKTFYRQNGTKYFENHHLVYQNNGTKDEGNENKLRGIVIDRDFNQFNLCSNCHNRIHYGTYEDRAAMIEFLFNQRESEFVQAICLYDKNLKGKELEWIKKMYNVIDKDDLE